MMTLFSQFTDQQLCLVLEELSKEVWSRVGRDAFEDSFVSKTMYDLDACACNLPTVFDVAGDYAENNEAA